MMHRKSESATMGTATRSPCIPTWRQASPALLISVNRRYRVHHSGIRITGLAAKIDAAGLTGEV